MEQSKSTISSTDMRKTFNAIDDVKRKIDELDDIWCEIENSGQIPMGHKYRGFMRKVDMLVCSTLNAIQGCVDAANDAGIGRTGEPE